MAPSIMIVFLGLLLFVGDQAVVSNAEMIPLGSNQNELITSFNNDNKNNQSPDQMFSGEMVTSPNNVGPNSARSVDSLANIPVLLAGLDSYKRPLYSKIFLQPNREISWSNLIFNRDGLSAARPRRYSYPAGNQSFLRFGRSRAKRPREAQETAFLRFGKSGSGSKISSTYSRYIQLAPSSSSSSSMA